MTDLYTNLFDVLSPGEKNIHYTLLNTFLTLEGARPACLVHLSKDVYETFKSIVGRPLIPYPYGEGDNYILIGPAAKPPVLERTLPIIRSGLYVDSSNDKKAQFHIATGTILGYFNPINILEARSGKSAIVNVYIDGKEQGIMAQRVGDASDDEIQAYYKPVLDALTDLYESKKPFPLSFSSPPTLRIWSVAPPTAKTRRRHRRRRSHTRKSSR
jgi:hypothetical protein